MKSDTDGERERVLQFCYFNQDHSGVVLSPVTRQRKVGTQGKATYCSFHGKKKVKQSQ